jgi:uncharacterized RDD family membrane protein YckC
VGALSDLVTGEAVVLGMQSARLPSRMIACAIDLAVLFAVVFGVTMALAFAAPDLDAAAAAAVVLSLTVSILVGIPVAVETLTRGRSLGKLALGLRVVRTDGGPVRFRHALVRGLVGFFEIILLTGVPATISSIVSDRGRRLGDVFAGTLVVRERVPGAGGGRAPLPPLPPQLMGALGGELASLDLSAVPDPLWLAVRQYLGRVQQLDPEVAWTMAHRLAADVTARTGRPAPAGLHPAAYLGAVLAERQNREWARTMAGQAAPSMYAPPMYAPSMPGPVAAPAPFAPASAPAPAATPAGPAPVPPPGVTGRPTDPDEVRGSGGGFAPPA